MAYSKNFRERISKFIRQLPHLKRSFQLLEAAAPGWTRLWFLLLIVQGALPVVTVYLTKALVDNLTAAFGSNPQPEKVQTALMLVFLMVLLQLFNEVLRATSTWVRAAVSEQAQDYINRLIHEKSISVDLAFYESPEFYDHLHHARSESSYRPVALIENVSILIQNFFTLIAMALVLIPFGWWIPVALVCSTLPALTVALRYIDLHHQWSRSNANNIRWSIYYSNLVTAREPAPEIRLFDLGSHLNDAYNALRKKLREERLALYKKQRKAEIFAGMTGYVIAGAAMSFMVWKTVQARVTLGELAMFYQAFSQGQRLMRTVLESLSLVYKNILFLEHLFEFLELQPRMVSPRNAEPFGPELKEGISFRNVTFRYPGSDRIALNDFHLEVASGQIAAIVGPNGAGKSTLVKLLCRFYDPDGGSIEFDGRDLRTINLADLRKMITVLFQEPIRYNATADQNIRFGDLKKQPEQEEIAEAARNAGAHEIISRLPQHYETLLGKSFVKGNELSVGEWQRVALARAFLREAPIILLDEPTSAMDSWAEEDWMMRLRHLLVGRTGIIITHRFTTAMKADVIHVMQEGRIIESGSHKELILLNGQYAHSWASQIRESSTLT